MPRLDWCSPPHNATHPLPSLVKATAAGPVSFMYSYLLRCLHGIATSYLAETPHLSSGVESRRRLRFNIDITRADDTGHWAIVHFHDRCMGLECSAGVSQNYWIVHCVQATDNKMLSSAIAERPRCRVRYSLYY